jgi:hypothetical protein
VRLHLSFPEVRKKGKFHRSIEMGLEQESTAWEIGVTSARRRVSEIG